MCLSHIAFVIKEWKLQAFVCWEPISGPLQDHYILSTTEPSL